MLTANIFSLLLNLTCVGVVIYVIYLALRGKPKHSETSASDSSSKYTPDQKITISAFIGYLKALKEEGKSTIDDVLKDLAKKLGTKISGSKEVVAPKAIEATPVIAKAPTQPMDSSNLLLYLGAFVFLFAMLIFAGFTWSVYSVGFKVALILVVPVVFFVVGYYIRQIPKFKTAAALFQVISAVTIGLAGVGIWNFTDISLSITFWSYWLWYSFFVVLAYSGFLALFRERKYRYFILVAVLSLITSVAYAYANTPELRFLVIALLNIALYGVVHVLSVEDDPVIVRTITVVNRILDISIVLTLLGSNPVSVGLQQIIVILALSVPWAFEIYRAVIEKDEVSSHIAVLTVVPKIFILSRLFGAETSLTLQLIAVSAASIIAMTELLLDESKSELRGSSRLFHSIVLGFLAILVIPWVSFLMPGTKGESILQSISSTDILLVTLAASVGFMMPFRNESAKPRFGFALLPLLFGVTGLIPYTPVVVAILGVSIVTLVVLYLLKDANEYERFGIISIAESTLLFSSWISLEHGTPLQIGLVFLIAALLLVVTRKKSGSKYSLLLVAPFLLVAVSKLEQYLGASDLLSAVSYSWNNIAWLLPLTFYGVIQFLPQFVKEQKQGTAMFVLFGLFAVLATYSLYAVAIVVLLVIAAFALTFIKRSSDKTWGAVLALVVLLLGRAIVHKLELPDPMVFFVNAGIVLTGMSALTLLQAESPLLYEKLGYMKSVFLGYICLHFLYGIEKSGEYQDRIHSISSSFTRTGKYSLSLQGELFLTVLGVLASTYALYIGPVSSFFKKLTGFGVVVSVWIIAGYYDANSQWYIVPLTLYLGVLAYIAHQELKAANSQLFEFAAIFIQGFSLFTQSVGSGTEAENLQYGIALIALSLIWTIVGNRSNSRIMYFLGLTFLVIELLIRLWVVIVLIPWWVYLAIIGLVLMGAGLYSVGKRKE